MSSPNIIIKSTNLDITDEIRDYVEKKFEKLTRYFDHILEVRIELEKMFPNHHNKGKIYRVEANIHVPNKILRVEKSTEDLRKSIDKVKDHMDEVINKYKEKLIEHK
ncbi:MAG: ribosome-associated translation inhibitor RaiA [bacterium]